MNQEILPPGRDGNISSKKELEIIDHSIAELRGRMGVFDRIRASFKAGENAANMLAAMQNDVLQAQRDVIQHHAQVIAQERKMQITDTYQASITELTRRVEERVGKETEYYWSKIYERLEHYDQFFQAKINDLRKKAESGDLPVARTEARIQQCEADWDEQLTHDRVLIKQLREANERVLHRALAEYSSALS